VRLLRKGICLTTILILIMLLAVDISMASPVLPASYWGTVSDNGQPVTTGYIEAIVDGSVCSNQAALNSQGYYCPNPEDGGSPKLLNVGGGLSDLMGKAVSFRWTNGSVRRWADPVSPDTVIWDNSEYWYHVDLVLAQAITGTDASLKSLSLKLGTLSPVFSSTVYKYNAELPNGTVDTPEVIYTLNNANASVSIQNAKSVSSSTEEDRTTRLTVVSGDGSKTQVYTIVFSVAPDLKGGCFIATAAYGSYLDPHVWVLRQFRDQVLLQHNWGRAFVNFYYHNSPPVAAIIAQHDSLRLLTRWLLTPLVCALEYPLWTLALLVVGLLLILVSRKRIYRTGYSN